MTDPADFGIGYLTETIREFGEQENIPGGDYLLEALETACRMLAELHSRVLELEAKVAPPAPANDGKPNETEAETSDPIAEKEKTLHVLAQLAELVRSQLQAMAENASAELETTTNEDSGASKDAQRWMIDAFIAAGYAQDTCDYIGQLQRTLNRNEAKRAD